MDPTAAKILFAQTAKGQGVLTDNDKALVERLRDEDSYYRWQEKHWCIDFDLLERLHLEAADRIEAQAAEIERLREALREVRSCTGEHYGAARALKIISAALGEME